MNTLLIAVMFAVCFALVACSGNAGNTNTASEPPVGAEKTEPDPAAKGPYPQAVVDEFLKSCEAAGSDARFCDCVLEKVQTRYSLEEFSIIESKISAGTPPEEFVEFTGRARAECLTR